MPHTKSNNQRHIRQASLQAGPAPQCSLRCLYPHPLFRWAKRRGGTVPSVPRSVSLALPPLQASLQLWGAS